MPKAHIEGDAEFLKEGVRALSQALMEMGVEEHIGAARHERTPGRKGQRNGYRQRIWDTRVGAVELSVPRVRDGVATSPRCWSPRGVPSGRSYVHGVSTRKVDELVKALGIRRASVRALCLRALRGAPLRTK